MQALLPGIGARPLDFGIGEAKQAPEVRDDILPPSEETLNSALHLLPDFRGRIALLDPQRPLQHVRYGEIGDVLGIGVGLPLPPLDLLEIQRGLELLDEPTFARARVPTDADDRPLPLPKFFNSLGELGHFGLPTDQLR